MNCVTVLQAGSPKPRGPGLLPAQPPSPCFSQVLGAPGAPWAVAASPQSLPGSVLTWSSSLCLSNLPPSLLRTPGFLSYVCKDLISK